MLEKYKFDRGAEKLPEDDRKLVRDFLDKNNTPNLPEALELTPERREAINQLVKAQVEWAMERLGIDVSDRSPAPEKVKIFHQKQYAGTGFGGLGGFKGATREAFVQDVSFMFNERTTLGNLNHELTHNFSSNVFRLDVQESNGKRQISLNHLLLGYNHTRGVLEGVNEWITETINIEILNYTKNRLGINYLDKRYIGYHNGVILWDMILQRVSEVTKKPVEEIRDNLYRGCYQGDTSQLRVLVEAFGKAKMAELSKMKGDEPMPVLRTLAESIGIDGQEYEERVRRYDEGKGVQIAGFEFQTPGNS